MITHTNTGPWILIAFTFRARYRTHKIFMNDEKKKKALKVTALINGLNDFLFFFSLIEFVFGTTKSYIFSIETFSPSCPYLNVDGLYGFESQSIVDNILSFDFSFSYRAHIHTQWMEEFEDDIKLGHDFELFDSFKSLLEAFCVIY